MSSNYRALSIISTVYKVIGALIFVGTVLLTVLSFISAGSMASRSYDYSYSYGSILGVGGIFGGLAVLLTGSLIALGVYATGEIFQLLVELAFNTRNTEANSRATNATMQQQARLLNQQMGRSEPVHSVPRAGSSQSHW